MHTERLAKFQTFLALKADLAFLPLSADLQYLTGIPREFPNFGAILHPGAWLEGLWMTPNHAPIYLLSRMTAEFGGMETSIQGDVRILGDWDDPSTMLRDLLETFDLPHVPRVAVNDRALADSLIHLQRLLPSAKFISATEILRPLRVIKSAEEIAILHQAGAVTEAAFADVLTHLKHGMTELDVMAEVDYQLKKHGAFGPSFTTAMYNSGPNHPLVHGHLDQKWHRKLEPPVSLLFDFGAIVQGYCYDFGRTVFFGEPTPEARRVHALVMAAQKAGIAALKSETTTAEQVDAAARAVIEAAGLGEHFRHRLGHSIGLDVHEPPFLTAGDLTLLKTGMAFTVEPSLLFPDGFSARVEDVVVVRPDGGEPLTQGWQDLVVVA